MTYVWVLVIYMSGYNAGGPAVIDNIATKDECARVQEILMAHNAVGANTGARCIQVGKVAK